jgi:nicotinate-nucleotide adenylyltransferase
VLNQYEEVEKIIFIPVNQKYPKEGLLSNEHRYNMLKLVADKNSKFIISDMDLQGDKSLPTIETLEKTQQQFPDKQICFLTGSDNLKEIHTWVRAEEVLSKYKIMIMERGCDDMDEIIENSPFLVKYKENFIKLNQEIISNCSSTYIRKQLENEKCVKYLVPDEVIEYIEKHQLYRRETL